MEIEIRIRSLSEAAPAGERVFHAKMVRIGSSPECDLVAAGSGVAPHHATVLFDMGHFWLAEASGAEVNVGGERRERLHLQGPVTFELGTGGPRFEISCRADAQAADAAGPMTVAAHLAPALETSTRYERVGEFALGSKEILLGRAMIADVLLTHPQVSYRHATVLPDGETHSIRDEGSTNGTFVNGRRIRVGVPERVRPDDLVQIGPYVLQMEGGKLSIYDRSRRTEIEAIDLYSRFGSRAVLGGISLRIKPGEFVGILGPSGSGKSSLIDALIGFRPAQHGAVLYNGINLYTHYASIKGTIGYVPQDDIVHKELTVERTIEYAAELRLPTDLSEKERRAIADQVIRTLELESVAKTPVARLSGGQRKRVSIAVELLTKPAVLFLDEPTAGLDPALEDRMMALFRRLADEGTTVVCTTHILENVDLFDKLCVVFQGRVAFFGTPGQLLERFGIAKVRDLYTRLQSASAETIAGAALGGVQSSAAQPGAYLSQADVTKRLKRPWKRFIPELSAGEKLRQWWILFRRNLEICLKDHRGTGILLAQAPIVAVLVLLIEHEQFRLFMLSLSSIWFGCTNAAGVITREWPIYRRERMVNLGILPYLASKMTVLMLLSALQVGCLVAVAFGAGKVAGSVSLHAVVLYLSALTGLGMGIFVSAVSETTEKATSLIPLVLIPQILLCGIFGKTPPWLARLVVTSWAYDGGKRLAVEGADIEAGLGLIPMDRQLELQAILESVRARLETDLPSVDRSIEGAMSVSRELEGSWSAAERDFGEFERLARRAEEIRGDLEREAATSRTLAARIKEDLGDLERESTSIEASKRALLASLLDLQGHPERAAAVLPEMKGLVEAAFEHYRKIQEVAGKLETSKAEAGEREQALASLGGSANALWEEAKVLSASTRTRVQAIEASFTRFQLQRAELTRLKDRVDRSLREAHASQDELHANMLRYVPLDPIMGFEQDLAALSGFVIVLLSCTAGALRRKDSNRIR